MSSNSNILSIISFSVSFITPCSCPTSTIDFISSFDTFSSKPSTLKPNNFISRFVDNDKNFIKGNVTFDTNKIGLTENIAITSAFCKAILFGNNSPKTKVIYDSITVTTTKAISLLYGIPMLFNNSPKVPDNPVAADALEKNPARVIPT